MDHHGGNFPAYPGGGGGGYPGYPQSGGGYPAAGAGYPAAGVGHPSPAGYQRREFYIVAELNGKVLDIRGGHSTPGAEVLVYHRNTPPSKNQLWYLDQQNCIRSALNDMVFHHDKKGESLKTQPFTGNPRASWRLEGNKIMNGAGECLDIRGAKNNDGAEVCAYDYKNKSNQHWRIEYVWTSNVK